MLTAAITAAVSALLALFGVDPAPYVVPVAIVVKVILVVLGVFFGARLFRRKPPAAAAEPAASADKSLTPP